MKKIFTLLWLLGVVAVPRGLHAQDASQEEDYKTMLQEAMKSGKYSQSQAETWDARVKKISGDVRVKASGSEEWVVLESGMPLDSYDSIKTADGIAEVYLDDKGSIAVGRNTELEMSSLSKGESVLTLKFGNLAAKIQHFLDEKLKMEVRTPSSVCAVRGTEFAVEYSRLGKGTGVAVFDEGRLAVSPLAENGQAQGEYLLEKNMELVFTPLQRRFRAAPLSRMNRYRSSIIAMRARVNGLRKNWKPTGEVRKAAMRDKVFKRNVTGRELDTPARVNKKGKRGPRLKKALKNKAKRNDAAPARDEEQ